VAQNAHLHPSVMGCSRIWRTPLQGNRGHALVSVHPSRRRMVTTETWARSACSRRSSARAARICSGVMYMSEKYLTESVSNQALTSQQPHAVEGSRHGSAGRGAGNIVRWVKDTTALAAPHSTGPLSAPRWVSRWIIAARATPRWQRLIRSEIGVLGMFGVRPCSRMERLLPSNFPASSPARRMVALPSSVSRASRE
jgi:hypothetical protein